jgi:hypothetical protein
MNCLKTEFYSDPNYFFGLDFADGQVFNLVGAQDFNGVDFSKFSVAGLSNDWSWSFDQLNDTSMKTLSITLNRTTASVAEPGSLGLGLLGLMMLVIGRRKSRK